MQISQIVFTQILIMFLLMGVGIILNKLKYFSKNTIKEINNFLIVFVISTAVINAFQMEYSKILVKHLFIALFLALIIHIFAILIAHIVFRKKDPKSNISKFASVYSNSSFMALPLLSSVFGVEGVFYGAAYIGIFNIFIWTHGIGLLTDIGKFKQVIKKIIKSPVILSVVVGVFLYVTNIRFGEPISSVLSYISSLNTPLAMILLGVFMTKCNFLEIFKDKKIYITTLLKLLIIPFCVLFGMILLKKFIQIDTTLALSMIISVSCPTGGTVAMMCERFDIDTDFSVKIITLTTALSLVSIPFIMYVAERIL